MGGTANLAVPGGNLAPGWSTLGSHPTAAVEPRPNRFAL